MESAGSIKNGMTSKIVLNVKAAIYQGCENYEQAKAILQNTDGTLQIYLNGELVPCTDYEESLDFENATSDTVTNSLQNLSDDDSEINDDTIIEVHTGTSTDNTDPKYIDTGSEETSCTKCEQLSNDCMLQCDVCTQWVHYNCYPSMNLPNISGQKVEDICVKSAVLQTQN